MHGPCAPFSLGTILFNLLAAHSLLHAPHSPQHTLPHILLHSPPCFTTPLPNLLTCIPTVLCRRSHPTSRSLQGWPTLRVTRTFIRFPSDHPEPTTSTLIRSLPCAPKPGCRGSEGTVSSKLPKSARMAHLTRHTNAHPLSLGPPGAYHVHADTQPPLRPKTWMPRLGRNS